MNSYTQPAIDPRTEENVLFGIIGAFLFALVGGALYVLLGLIGFIASISGLVTVVCAIKGYTFFAKKETKRGIIIAVIISAIVIVLAWYIGFCLDVVSVFGDMYEAGEIDYKITFFEYAPIGFYDLPLIPEYFWNLALSLIFAAGGCWSEVSNRLKRQKAMAAAAQAPAFDAYTEAQPEMQTEAQPTENNTDMM